MFRVETPSFPDELACVGGTGLDTEELWGGCDPLYGADLGGGLLDAVDDDGEEEFQALLADRSSNRSPCNTSSAPPQQQDWYPMRGSYSLNDLTLLQQPAAQPPLPLHWAGLNSKLVSAKPKLEPVPEGGPSHMDGGTLHLLPLGSSAMDAQTLGGVKATPAAAPHCGLVHASSSPALPMDLSHFQLQKRAAAAAQHTGRDSPLENESSSDSMPRSMPSSSCNTLSTQLQMTHVTSESQLSSLEQQQHQLAPLPPAVGGKGAVQGSTAAAVETFRQTCTLPTESGPGDLQGEGEGSSGVQQGPGGRMPSSLPLRKSQSAVELGSWRDNFCWDTSEEGQYVGHPQLSSGLEERSAPKIQRYRERRAQRNQARAPSYHTSRAKGGSPPMCGSPRVELHNGRKLPCSASGGALHWGAEQGGAEAHALPGGMSSGASSSALDSHAYAASAPSHMGGHMRSRSLHQHQQQLPYGLSHSKPGEPYPQYGGFSAYGAPLQPQMSSQVGSPQGGGYMQAAQPARAAQRSRSFQSGLSSATYFPPPVPPSCKLGMVGGANLPAASSYTNLAQQDGSNSPLGSSPPSHLPLLPSLLSRPPRMLAPCLPASHPLAGPSPSSGNIYMPGNLSQQLATPTGSSCVAPHLSLSGNPMQAPLPNLPPTGQTIFTIGSARARSKPTPAPPSPPALHTLQSSPMQEASTCASPVQPCMPAAMVQGSNNCMSSGPMQLA